MVSMMLVAGSASKSLADFLENRGTFTVTNVYSSLKENAKDIQSQIIKVDKLLYLFNSEATSDATDIRTEMRILGKLLKDSTFFNPAEIIFMLRANESSEVAIKYFKTIVEGANFDNYTIKQIEGKLTYEIVYSSVMGISQVRDFENTYRSVYKVSRDTSAELAYAAQDNADMLIQLAGNYRLDDYEAHRDLLVRTVAKDEIPITEQARRKGTVDIPSASVAPIEITRDLIVITGAGKSGKSVWSTVLSVSAREAGKRVCIIDLTNNGDMEFFLSKTNMGCDSLTFRDFVEKKKYADVVCCHPTQKEREVAIPFINYVLDEVVPYDCIYVVTELCDYEHLKCIQANIKKTIVLTTARQADIEYVSRDVLKKLYGSVCVILNNQISSFTNDDILNNTEIRKYISDDYRVIGSKKFTSLDVDSTFYKGVIK